jgi:hypothetical protein
VRTDEEILASLTDIFDLTMIEIGEKYDGGVLARRFAVNHARRISDDPGERAYQQAYDRMALDLERRMIYGKD